MYRGWISRKFRSQIWDGEIEGDRNWDGFLLGICVVEAGQVGGLFFLSDGWFVFCFCFVLVVEAQGRKLCYLMSIRENSQTMHNTKRTKETSNPPNLKVFFL